MAPNSPSNRKIIVAISVVLFVVLVVVVTVLTTKSPNSKATPTPSASTVAGTPGPDSIPKGPSMPTFAGFDSLIQYGASSNQLDALKYAFFKYEKSSSAVIKNVTLDTKTISVVPHDRYSASTSDFINFKVALDSATYSAKFEYTGFYASRLYLYTTGATNPMYDSGTIDLFHGIGNN